MATTLALRLERLFFPPVPTMPTAVSDWLPSLCSSLYISPLTLVLLVILPEVPIRLPCILGVNVLHLQSKNKHVNLFVQQCFQKSFFFFLIKKLIVSLDNFSFFLIHKYKVNLGTPQDICFQYCNLRFKGKKGNECFPNSLSEWHRQHWKVMCNPPAYIPRK